MSTTVPPSPGSRPTTVKGSIHHLELNNFKSYKGTLVIGPFHNFQAIVGPNGAGKSNLMDAISFVLGVRSVQLRSSQLKDLIHRPEGAGEPTYGASVALVFEPEEGETLRFERVISAKGACTYKLNGRTVTWEGYNETLKGLGILVEARNFLIFQGDVESIASKTPAELSLLMEHVSGSIELKDEYEVRKREKERAEENTIFNFNKKKTLKAEKKQYKQQKDEAEAWQELSRERGEIMQEQALFQLFHIANELDLVSVAHTAQVEEEAAVSARKAHIATTVKARKKEKAKAHRAVLGLQKKLLAVQAKMSKAKPLHIKLKTQIEHVAGKLADKRDALARKEGDAAKQAEALASLHAMVDELDGVVAAFEASLPESLRSAAAGEGAAAGMDISGTLNVSSRLDEVLDAEQLGEYHELKAMAAAETGALAASLATAARKLEDERTRLQVAQNKADDVSARVVLLRGSAASLAERQATAEAYIAKQADELETCSAAHASVSAQASNAATRMEEVTALLVETQAKLAEASAATRKSKHEAKLADALEAMKRLFPGVHGKVVHLCATQPKYQLALTVAMGRYVDAIVVDTQATAIECIEYMRENRVGTATFLPLNSLKLKPVDERFRSLGGSATLALDVVEYDEPYEPAFQFILGSTVLCQGLTEARALAFGTSGIGVRKKVVTWDGTKITKSGLITGGSAGDDSSASLWSERKVAEHRAARSELEAELASLAQSRRLKSQADSLAARIGGLESRLASARADLAVTKDKAHDVETEIASLLGQLASLQPTIAALQSQVAAGEADVARLEADIAAVEDRIFGDLSAAVGVASIRELEASALAEAQRAAKKRLAYSKQRAQLNNQIAYESSHDYTPEIATLNAGIAAEEAELAAREAKAADAAAAVAALVDEKSGLEVDLANAMEAEDEVGAQIKLLKADEVRLGKEHSALITAITASEGALESLTAKRGAILQRCLVDEVPVPLVGGGHVTSAQVLALAAAVEGAEGPEGAGPAVEDAEIEIDFAGLARALKAVDRSTERMDPAKYAEYDAAFEERLRLISKDIETMAPNMKAIERLDDLAAKFKETTRDFEAARNASKSANDHFVKIQKARTARYRHAFDHISRVIDEIYKELTRSELNYGGGTAFLSLESPEEPYLRGVKFNAMPPNKRFRNMEYLSGGEKTVAALALLFAIHSYRPSPFFVMDEVDAALDSKNVKRVAEYIRARSADFQCIVISLKDQFFDKADALVGIYRDRDDPDSDDAPAPTFSRALTLDLRQYA